MKKHLWSLSLVTVGLVLSSCGPDYNTYYPNPNPTRNYPLLEAFISMQNGATQPALVDILTSSNAVTNAAVTLTSTGLTLPLTFTTSQVTTYAGSPAVQSAYSSGSGVWTYTAGQAYTMTVSLNSSTYSSSITTVGNVVFNTGSSGVTTTWTGGVPSSTTNPQDLTYASASETSSPFNFYSFPASLQPPYLTSPMTITAASLSGHTSGNYTITLNAETFLSSTFPGANTGSFFSAIDQESTTY